jgi:hypothetical protein
VRAVDRDWVVAAAERAEQRLRGEMPRYVRIRQSGDRGTTLATQLQALIAAIMNPHVTRKRLRQLAEALSRGPIGSAMSAEAGRRLSNKNDTTAPMLKALLSTRDPQEVVAPPFSLENGPGDQHCH